MSDTYVVALLRERDGYRRAGMADRMRAVDAELKRFGVAVDDGPELAVEPPSEFAVARRPRGRPPRNAA